MIELRQTEAFERWLRGLNDVEARAGVLVRLRRLSLGNRGDARPVGGGISELRIHHGAGYRVYFLARGTTQVILLLGGTKATQATDIRTARELAQNL
jgi:putative addiction module killer protein